MRGDVGEFKPPLLLVFKFQLHTQLLPYFNAPMSKPTSSNNLAYNVDSITQLPLRHTERLSSSPSKPLKVMAATVIE